MTEPPEHGPDAGYDTHEHTLRSADVNELMQSTAEKDRRDNQFNNNVSGPGAGGRWDPETELDLTPDDTLGLASGVGLNAGPDGTISLAELKRRARKKRESSYAAGCREEYERARREAQNGTDIEDIEPVDATDL